MFGRKCSLCGGKLDGQGICTECGLDNTKNDRAYHSGQRGCDDQMLTHVHTENTMEEGDRKRKTVQKKPGKTQYGSQGTSSNPIRTRHQMPQNYSPVVKPKKRKRGCAGILLVLVLIIIVVSFIGQFLEETNLIEEIEYKWENIFENDQTDESEYGERDPYSYVTREIPAEGSEESYTLSSGCYIVGVHIPEGIYQADMDDDFDVIQVDDPEQGIYLYEYRYLEEENNCHLDDLRLYEGAVLYVETNTQAVLSTSNAQPMKEAAENPLSQEYNLKGTVTAGMDFEPGVYDLEMINEGYVTLYVVLDEESDYYIEKSFLMGESYDMGTRYQNLVIPKGAELRCDSGVEIRLIPSQIIFSTDYQSFYETY